jgi:hypothetical protein
MQSSLKVNNFTLKDRLPDDITINLKKGTPGPGKYEAISINAGGKYPTSKFKNTRYIIIDGLKKAPKEEVSDIGPGSCNSHRIIDDLFNSESKYNAERINLMRRTRTKTFGTAKRRGP